VQDTVEEKISPAPTADGEPDAAPPAPEFISEDDLATFEGWMKYQGFDDVATLAPDQLEMWRGLFDETHKAPTPKVGLMKLPPLVPSEYRYAVAIREGSDLWLTLWVRRSRKGEFFVLVPRADRSWNPHASYHRDGTFHSKTFNDLVLSASTRKLQPLTGPFVGTEHLGGYGGHGGKSIGAVCDPTAFSKIVEVGPGVLGPRDGTVVVDLVQPGCEPLSWPGEVVKEEVLKDAEPWIVIRIIRPQRG
jgi:hypothetical protein